MFTDEKAGNAIMKDNCDLEFLNIFKLYGIRGVANTYRMRYSD